MRDTYTVEHPLGTITVKPYRLCHDKSRGPVIVASP
jgi:hypothetical protein